VVVHHIPSGGHLRLTGRRNLVRSETKDDQCRRDQAIRNPTEQTTMALAHAKVGVTAKDCPAFQYDLLNTPAPESRQTEEEPDRPECTRCRPGRHQQPTGQQRGEADRRHRPPQNDVELRPAGDRVRISQ
jgi:hypothetical protein